VAVLEELYLLTGIPALAVIALQSRFVVEEIEVARSTGHEQLDDTLYPGTMVEANGLSFCSCQEILFSEKRCERNSPEAASGSP
jgi:hypothetical protein